MKIVHFQNYNQFDSRGPATSAHLRNWRVLINGQVFGYFACKSAAENAAIAYVDID